MAGRMAQPFSARPLVSVVGPPSALQPGVVHIQSLICGTAACGSHTALSNARRRLREGLRM